MISLEINPLDVDKAVELDQSLHGSQVVIGKSVWTKARNTSGKVPSIHVLYFISR